MNPSFLSCLSALACFVSVLTCSSFSVAETEPDAAGSGATDSAEVSNSTGSGTEPATADAQTPMDPKVEAAQRFNRGLSFYDEGAFALALIEFERAYQLVPNYRVLYNVGQVSIQLERFARAREALLTYLAEGGQSVAPERVAAVRKDLDMLRERTARVALTTNPGDATIIVDGIPLDQPLPGEGVLLDAGEHKLEVRRDGYVPDLRRLVLAGAESLSLEIELRPESSEERQVVVVQRAEAAPRERETVDPAVAAALRRRRTQLWVSWSATGVLGASAATFGILSLSAQQRAQSIEDEPNPDVDEFNGLQSRAKRSALIADILTASTVAAGSIALYFTLRRGPERSEKIELGVTHRGLQLRRTF